MQPTAFSALLRYYRSRTTWTQERLAERAQLSVDTVRKLERGLRSAPHCQTVRRLADALNLSTQEYRLLDRAARQRPARIYDEKTLMTVQDVLQALTALAQTLAVLEGTTRQVEIEDAEKRPHPISL